MYRKPTLAGADDLELMRLIDERYLKTPFYGARKMAVVLRRSGHHVGRKRVTRLMRVMGIEAIYRKPNLSRRHPQHKIYPYLLRNMEIDRIHQVWSCDIRKAKTRSVGWREARARVAVVLANACSCNCSGPEYGCIGLCGKLTRLA